MMMSIKKSYYLPQPMVIRWLCSVPFKREAVLALFLITMINFVASAQNIQFSPKGQTNNSDSLLNSWKNKYSPKAKTIGDSLSERWKSKYSPNSKINGDSLSDSWKSKYSSKTRINSDSISDRWSKSKFQQRTDAFESSYQKASRTDFSKYLNKDSLHLKNNKATARYSRFYKRAEKFQKANEGLIDKYSGLKLDSNTVFNNKFMRKYQDSLSKIIPKQPSPPFKEVSKENMAKQVNEKFLHKVDSVKDSSSYAGEFKKRKEWADLNYAKLRQADAQDLKPMATTLVEDKFLKKLDSIKIVDLKAARLKLDEKETAAQTKLAAFRQKETMWQKSYFEGVVGLSPSESGFQFSPAMAYHILPSWSVGAGPNVIVDATNNDLKFNVGIRALSKFEMLERSAYLQMEDQIKPNVVGVENKTFTQHNLMAGGGYVLPFLSPISFNFSLMYKFYSNGDATQAPSNWLFRIGISTNKKPK